MFLYVEANVRIDSLTPAPTLAPARIGILHYSEVTTGCFHERWYPIKIHTPAGTSVGAHVYKVQVRCFRQTDRLLHQILVFHILVPLFLVLHSCGAENEH